jgi:GNAT superfamily N-acetyltransferase
MSWVVGPATHTEVMQLRMPVLRPGQPYDASRYVGEDAGFNLAAREGERLVGCATFFPQAFPGPGEEDGPPDAHVPAEAEGLVAWRLRGMATAPDLRSTGVGSAVLAAGLTAVREAGGDLVWCNGRTQAMSFYRRHGFSVIGSEFLSGGAEKVPHYRAWIRLGA